MRFSNSTGLCRCRALGRGTLSGLLLAGLVLAGCSIPRSDRPAISAGGVQERGTGTAAPPAAPEEAPAVGNAAPPTVTAQTPQTSEPASTQEAAQLPPSPPLEASAPSSGDGRQGVTEESRSESPVEVAPGAPDEEPGAISDNGLSESPVETETLPGDVDEAAVPAAVEMQTETEPPTAGQVELTSLEPAPETPGQPSSGAEQADLAHRAQRGEAAPALPETAPPPSVPATELASASPTPSTVTLETREGTVKLRLAPEQAPRHVAEFLRLNTGERWKQWRFHHVLPGRRVELGSTSGPTATPGAAPRGLPFEGGLRCERGALGAQRSPRLTNSLRESEPEQFFILLRASPELEGEFTVFGIVEEGLDVLERLAAGPEHLNGAVVPADRADKILGIKTTS